MMSLAAAAAAAAAFSYSEQYRCAVCAAVARGQPCARFGACDIVAGGIADCAAAGHCTAEQAAALAGQGADAHRPRAASIDLRVAKGLGSKPYDTLRVSAVTAAGSQLPGFDYSAPFKFKWTDNALHTKLVAHPSPGGAATFDVGGTQVRIRLPAAGGGTAGLLIGDPAAQGSPINCQWCAQLKMYTRTPEMINAIMARDDIDYWGILGDNFYDQNGVVTRAFYDKLELATTSKIFLTTAGNHDYWVIGDNRGDPNDQYGNGFMQWYAQDSKAAEGLLPGGNSSGAAPFDFSRPPDTSTLPVITNTFWYNQIGNVGFVGFSGAYSVAETTPLVREACAWLGAGSRANGGTVDVGVLVGHWDVPGLGAPSGMDVPGFYSTMRALPGCDALDGAGMLKFFMGHTHCNTPHPHGYVDAGFEVAGFGMVGCGNYGFPILDTTDRRVRVWHFEVVKPGGVGDTYDATLACIKAKGWRGCTDLADKWLDQPLPVPAPPTPAPPPTPRPPTPAPTPAPPPPVWVRHAGTNCYADHGATPIDDSPCGTMTLAACEARCAELATCGGVTVLAQQGGLVDCWRRKDIVIEDCATGGAYDTWVRTGAPSPAPPAPHPTTPAPTPAAGWVEHAGRNCYAGVGADDLENPPGSSCGAMSVAACEAKCGELAACTAVVTDAAGGDSRQCYRRANVVLARCSSNPAYDLYVRGGA